MKINCNIKNHLWSVCYNDDNPNTDILKELFEKWTDTEYIDKYVEKKKNLLKNDFFLEYSIEEIKMLIYTEALELEKFLKKLCENSINNKKPDLDQYFKDFNKNSTESSLVKKKMYGRHHNGNTPSLLRLYAIKVSKNAYILTGGAIKLVQKMQNSKDTQNELNKIQSVKKELARNKINYITDLYILES